MKKKIIALTMCALGGMAMILPSVFAFKSTSVQAPTEDVGPAPGFEDDLQVRLDNPLYANEDEEMVEVNKLILHYHNDDNACLSRRFYTWVTGVDGIERKPLDNDTYKWTATDMAIVLDFNEILEYANMPSLYFIIKVAGTWAGQSEDILLDYSKYTVVDGVLEVWTIPGEGSSIEIYETEEETKFPKIQTAKFSDWYTIHCKATDGYVPKYYKVYAFDKNYLISTESTQIANKEFHLFKSGTPTGNEFDIVFNYKAKINVQYLIESEYVGYEGRVQKIVVSCENLYETERFETFYTYDGNDLGATYTPTSTTFKVWSPISALVTLNLFDTGTPKALGGSDASLAYRMNYTKGGVWQVEILGDLKGKFYTYSVTHSSGTVESIDPYAKACGINGYRGAIYDPADTNPNGWDSVPSKWDGVAGYDINSYQDLAIYEVHIRDLTMDETWISNKDNKHGTYQAFAEKGTSYTKDGKTVTTGYDHIEELGVNAIQLLPVFDHDDDERPEKMKFNWGYNPLNYNCVEGGYSSDPYDPVARIKEYKELIKAYSENANHTRVVMDVVYNHVSSASSSCFTKIMPKYYFRYDENWNYLDGSGCANEVKSDATMMRKYIVDSLIWWATEYKVKGFRFDLMGLIDSWTMREVKEKMYAIDPDIYVYGEGWTSGGYHGKWERDSYGNLINAGCEVDNGIIYSQLYDSPTSRGYVGSFNNGGRDYLKGSNDNGFAGSPYPQWGFVSQGSDSIGDKSSRVGDMLKGINPYNGGGANPLQTINYASCHDNYTLWDQLRYTLAPNGYYTKTSYDGEGRPYDVAITPYGDEEPDTNDLVRASLMTHAAVFASNGAAFILGGEELYRSKTYEDAEELAELMEGGADAVVRPFGIDYPQNYHYTTDPDLIQATSEVEMYGKITSHNSYKASDSINKFRWDRKISVNGVDVSTYNSVWSKMISLHTKTAKYSYPENMDTASFNVWSTGNGSTGVALWNGNEAGTSGYYFLFAGREGAKIGFGGFDGASIVFATRNDYSFSNSVLTLQPFTFICARKGA